MKLNFEDTQVAFSYKSLSELKKAKWLFASMANPFVTKWGIAATSLCLKWKLPIKSIIKSTIFKQFCGGETLQEADITASTIKNYGVNVIMDYGVEGKNSEDEFEKTVASFLETIRFAANKSYIPFVSLKVTGFCRFALLEKMHAGDTLTIDEEKEFERFLKRIDTICYVASQNNTLILIDAEESWIQQPVDDTADKMMAKYNKEKCVVYNTFQLYRHDRLAFLKESHNKSLENKYILGAKLVRGAYMEKERQRAIEMQYPSPIQPDKNSTDRDYDAAITYCIENLNSIALFVGTHNENSCMHATLHMQNAQLAPNDSRVWFSQLFGMSDNISFNLAKHGYLVAKYLPYGPVGDVIPYLMRRAQENTSVAGQTSRELSLINKEFERRKKEK